MSEDNMLHTISELLEEAYPRTEEKKGSQSIEVKKNNFFIMQNGFSLILTIAAFVSASYLIIQNSTAAVEAISASPMGCSLTDQQISLLDKKVKKRINSGETYQKIYSDWRKKYGHFRKDKMPCDIYLKIMQE